MTVGFLGESRASNLDGAAVCTRAPDSSHPGRYVSHQVRVSNTAVCSAPQTHAQDDLVRGLHAKSVELVEMLEELKELEEEVA